MRRLTASCLAFCVGCLLAGLSVSAQEPFKGKLLIACSTYKDRPKHAQIWFYEHDGVSQGKMVGSIETVNNRQDSRPSLTLDGKLCVFASELENETSKIFVYDRESKKLIDHPEMNKSPNALIAPTIDGKATLIAFQAWDRPGASSRWDVLFYDPAAKKMQEKPEFNSPNYDERMPCLSADGRWLAYVTNARGGVGLTDIRIFDRTEKKTYPIPEANSPGLDTAPSLSGDGRLLAFATDRTGGVGGLDIYLFDRAEKKFVPLPGLNSIANDQSPRLSPDGRWLVFVSERIKGEGERDVFLYDLTTKRLVPTPGLNSKREDLDPCVIALP
ncbi:MAG: hypothetical protein U0744_17075 [Gemmataceae bacterium]